MGRPPPFAGSTPDGWRKLVYEPGDSVRDQRRQAITALGLPGRAVSVALLLPWAIGFLSLLIAD